MSTNAKNIIRQEYLKNFTKDILRRLVITAESDKDFRFFDSLMVDINHNLNKILQDINLKTLNRSVPYMTLCVQHSGKVEKDSRVFVRNYETSPAFIKNVKAQLGTDIYLSHSIELLVAEGYNVIDRSEVSDVEIVVSKEFVKGAIIDIALDIAMFHSYSFLRDLDFNERRRFSKRKFEFSREQGIPSFYECENGDLPYFSLAFLARKSKDEFNVRQYIHFWEEFIRQYFPGYSHVESSMEVQIQKHVDFEELPKDILQRLEDKPAGAYLILRTNTDRTENLQPQIFSLFGIPKYRKGRIKIVEISKYSEYKVLLENLDVSAFKIVKSSYVVKQKSPEKPKPEDGKNHKKTVSLGGENVKNPSEKAKVFLVHGHDNEAKTETARLLEKAGFDVVILNEQASIGDTIIEMLEKNTDVQYAVVLYTPCDYGRAVEDSEDKFRARQNVILEHGYLMGKLGRRCVTALVKGCIETPSDVSGVMYIPMDPNGGWKLKLAKNMLNVGLEFDLGGLM